MGDSIDELDRDTIVAWIRANLIDAAGVAQEIGLTHRNNVYSYRRIYPDFPEPILTDNRCYRWLRSDIRAWKSARSGN